MVARFSRSGAFTTRPTLGGGQKFNSTTIGARSEKRGCLFLNGLLGTSPNYRRVPNVGSRIGADGGAGTCCAGTATELRSRRVSGRDGDTRRQVVRVPRVEIEQARRLADADADAGRSSSLRDLALVLDLALTNQRVIVLRRSEVRELLRLAVADPSLVELTAALRASGDAAA